MQHHLERQSAAVWAALQAGGHFYVCGDAKAMARDVHRALVALVQKHKKCTAGAAEAYVKELHDAGRLKKDVW